jgi:flagellar biosynthesis anti-sigma factor FlgM
MKIYNNSGVSLDKLYPRQLEEKQGEAARPRDEQRADTLSISGEAAQVREAAQAAEALEEARMEKVQQVKASILQGSFAADSSKIAAAMLHKKS